MRMRFGRRGSSLIETALFIPILLLLLMGMIEVARITYTYYSLRKVMFSLARYLSVQQAANFCDSTNAVVNNAKTFALDANLSDGQTPIFNGITADQIDVRLETFNTDTQSLDQCDCGSSGCDPAQNGRTPGFIVVSIPNGYQIVPRIPYVFSDPILLRPQVRVPFGGT